MEESGVTNTTYYSRRAGRIQLKITAEITQNQKMHIGYFLSWSRSRSSRRTIKFVAIQFSYPELQMNTYSGFNLDQKHTLPYVDPSEDADDSI